MEEPEQAFSDALEAVRTILSFSIAHSSEESNQALADFLRRLLLETSSGCARTAVYRAALCEVERHAMALKEQR